MKRGLVVKTTGSWHTVKVGNEIRPCRLKGTFRIRDLKITNPVAVGDFVNIDRSGNDNWVITHIEDRRNYIIRKSTNLSKESQIMASNLDQVMLMFTLDFPETPLEFVDRFLVAAEAYHIPVVLVINKTDLYSGEKSEWMKEVTGIYEYAGYRVVCTSLTSGMNLNEVSDLLSHKTTLIAGNSGVGKSSLINYLCPGLNLKTNDISRYHQAGKHTTTYPEMVSLSDDTFVVDSPGIRGFGITDLEKNEIGLYFKDIFRLSKDCRFYNCTHTHEPDCAVIKAYDSGVLHESRYRSYFNIFHDADGKYRTG